jgi:hypothetical protein
MRQADNGALNFVTRRQFRAVARAIEAEARRDALEEAAKVADSMAPEFGEKGWAAKDRGDLSLSLGMLGVEFQLKTCAQSIRALKETIQ